MLGARPILKKVLAGLLITTFLTGIGLYRLDKLNSIPIDPVNFSWINKAEIYVLGIVMSAIAYPIYPEVAREHMMMYTPFDTAPKVIIDDFFRGSLVVEDGIIKAKKLGRHYRLAWPANTYRLSFDPLAYKEARIALALNGGFIRIEGDRVIVSIKIAYPRKSFAPLIHISGIGTIGVEEGLYWILQKEGWLYEGYVEWIEKIETKI